MNREPQQLRGAVVDFANPRAGQRLMTTILVAFTVLVVPIASQSVILAAGVAFLGILMAVTAWFGFERTGMGLLVGAFALTPANLLNLGSKYLLVGDVFFLLAVAMLAPRILRTQLKLPTPFVAGSVLLCCLGLIASLLAPVSAPSFVYIAGAVIALSLMPAIVVWIGPTDRQMWSMALAFGIGTSLSCLYGLPTYTYRNAGFTYHPVALGYTSMLTLAYMPFLVASKVRGRWVVLPIVAFMALVGVWTSGSRTGLVVLAALALLVPVLEKSIPLGLTVAGIGVVLLAKLAAYDPSKDPTSALSRLMGQGGSQGSDAVREDALRGSWEQIQSHPYFGTGYSIDHTYTIHNLYLQVLTAEGPLGLLGLLMILGVLVLPLVYGSGVRRLLAYPAVAVILAGPFQPNMADHYLALTLGLSLVAASSIQRPEILRTKQPERPLHFARADT